MGYNEDMIKATYEKGKVIVTASCCRGAHGTTNELTLDEAEQLVGELCRAVLKQVKETVEDAPQTETSMRWAVEDTS